MAAGCVPLLLGIIHRHLCHLLCQSASTSPARSPRPVHFVCDCEWCHHISHSDIAADDFCVHSSPPFVRLHGVRVRLYWQISLVSMMAFNSCRLHVTIFLRLSSVSSNVMTSVVVTVLTIFLCICRLRFLLPAVFMASVYNEATARACPQRSSSDCSTVALLKFVYCCQDLTLA